MKKNGFSIIELLTILGIIGIISLITIPLFINYQKTSKLKNEARLLATNLRLTQQLAITEQNVYYLKLSPASNKYQIINSKTESIIKEVNLNTEVSIETITGFTDDKIQFTATGGVIEIGSIVLTNTVNEISTLQIKPSGYVEIIE